MGSSTSRKLRRVKQKRSDRARARLAVALAHGEAGRTKSVWYRLERMVYGDGQFGLDKRRMTGAGYQSTVFDETIAGLRVIRQTISTPTRKYFRTPVGGIHVVRK